ncbi:MAG: methyltransferase [Pseudomonadota bacterium]
MRILAAAAVPFLFAASVANADALEDKVAAALASDLRTPAETERDRNRKPLETLQFFGLRDDMRVLELIPGGGWYTKILAPVLAENGKLYVALGTSRVKDRLADKEGFEEMEILEVDANFNRDGPFGTNSVDQVDFPVDDLDMVLTFRNLHNFTADARAKLNTAVFDSLKAGGLYGVVDHTARHMEPQTAENRRRLDPMIAVKEALDAGFEFVAFSDLHYKPDDELRYEVGRKSVTGNTDRFTLLFRKP